MSVDVLAYLVEVISHMSFDEFLRHRVFERLNMPDTYFSLPEDKLSCLATLYKMNRDNTLIPATEYFQYPAVQTCFSGGVHPNNLVHLIIKDLT